MTATGSSPPSSTGGFLAQIRVSELLDFTVERDALVDLLIIYIDGSPSTARTR